MEHQNPVLKYRDDLAAQSTSWLKIGCQAFRIDCCPLRRVDPSWSGERRSLLHKLHLWSQWRKSSSLDSRASFASYWYWGLVQFFRDHLRTPSEGSYVPTPAFSRLWCTCVPGRAGQTSRYPRRRVPCRHPSMIWAAKWPSNLCLLWSLNFESYCLVVPANACHLSSTIQSIPASISVVRTLNLSLN